MVLDSKTPLIKKLGIKPGTRIIFINEPPDLVSSLEIPRDVRIAQSLHGQFNYIHLFTTSKKELEEFFLKIKNHLEKDGMVWISWLKGASKYQTDLNENIIREIGLESGLVDVKIAAIDELWSGLKFVFRLKER